MGSCFSCGLSSVKTTDSELGSTSEVTKTVTFTTGRSEVTNLTWKVGDSFGQKLSSPDYWAYESSTAKKVTFETGRTSQLACTWILKFESPTVYDKMEFLKIKVELVKKGPSVPENILALVAVEILLKLNTGSGFEYEGCSFTEMHVLDHHWFYEDLVYKKRWTLETVNIRFEVFNFDHRNMMTCVRHKLRFTTFQKIQNLFNEDNNFSDFKIKMKDGKEFRVHKAILASQSPVFSKMFTSNDMIEASSGMLEIVDLSSEAMEVILKFIYSGVMDEEWMNLVEELIYAGDKYDLKLLIQFCDAAIVKTCKPQNAIDLLKTAQKFRLKMAERDIKVWISENMTAQDVLNATVLI